LPTDVSLWPIYDRRAERPLERRQDRASSVMPAIRMRPFMAAGGAMAVEDGVILSPLPRLHSTDHNEAFSLVTRRAESRGFLPDVQRISIGNSWIRTH